MSVGWRVSQESFLKSSRAINDLKLRASYGSTGSNANITGTNAVDTYNYGFGNTAYAISGGLSSVTKDFAKTSIGNPKTTWETDKILNFGVDATLFNHLDLNVEWYKKSISGLLFPLSLPSTAGGASFPIVNIGDVRNHGIDVAATYHGSVGRDFKLTAGVYATTYKNKILKLNNTDFFDLFGGSRMGSFVREQAAAEADVNMVRSRAADPTGLGTYLC